MGKRHKDLSTARAESGAAYSPAEHANAGRKLKFMQNGLSGPLAGRVRRRTAFNIHAKEFQAKPIFRPHTDRDLHKVLQRPAAPDLARGPRTRVPRCRRSIW